MSAREIVAQLVRTSVIPVVRPAGFTTAGFSFHRRRDTVVQVINVQLSSANVGQRGAFYLNVGLNFDPICALEGRPIVAKPKAHECQFQRRLEQLVPGAPARWEFEGADAGLALAAPLRAACEGLLDGLNRAFSMEQLLGLGWLGGGSERGLLAQIHYLLGQREQAVAALRELRAFFQDRPMWSLQRELERRGLTPLLPELAA